MKLLFSRTKFLHPLRLQQVAADADLGSRLPSRKEGHVDERRIQDDVSVVRNEQGAVAFEARRIGHRHILSCSLKQHVNKNTREVFLKGLNTAQPFDALHQRRCLFHCR